MNILNPLNEKIYFNYKFGKKLNFNNNLSLDQNLINDCKNIIKKTLTNMLFSKFPYFIYDDIKGNLRNPIKESPHSQKSALKYNEGNCVSFAYYFKNEIEKLNNNYKCYVIPAGAPQKFSVYGSSKLCHVANCIPFNNGFLLIDCAFYIN